jgi:alkylation response protein AidB-like acyl-CoA dehydrogenase
LALTAEGKSLVEALSALVPEVAANAGRAERDRKPVDSVMAAIEATGAYRSFVPRCYGGWELDLDTFVDVGILLGEACTSTGWVTTFCLEHNWMVAQFPRQAQEEIFGEKGYVIAPGALATAGTAMPVEGGFRLQGRWQWGTGVMHASWVLLGGVVPDSRDMRMFALPVGEVEVLDNWDSSGMVGTGSNDIVVHDRFVPAHRAQLISEMAVGRSAAGLEHGTPMFRMPMLPILSLAAGTPAIGAAKAALGHFIERSRNRTLFGSNVVQADQGATHVRVALARARLETAEILARQVAAETMGWGECEEVCGAEDRAKLRLRMAYAVRLCRDVVRDLVEAAGANAQLAGQPLERIHRDIHTIASHTVFDVDAVGEQYGRILYGLKPTAMV